MKWLKPVLFPLRFFNPIVLLILFKSYWIAILVLLLIRLRDKPRIGHSCAPAIANGLTISIFDAASLQKGKLFPSFS